MAFDDETDDGRPLDRGPLPPDDRLWRHPSELAGTPPPPSSWTVPAPRPQPRRSVLVAAVASAGLAGAVVAMGVMWMAGPTRTVTDDPEPRASLPVTTASYSAAINSAALARRTSPAIVHVTAATGDEWSHGTGVWLDAAGSVAVATSIVDGADGITVTDHTGHRTAALAAGSDAATGITVLRVADLGAEPATIAAKAPAAGEAVAVIGTTAPTAAGTGSPRVVTGSISAVGVRTSVDDIVLHDAVELDRALPADSIGGMAVDAEGDMVGIVLAPASADGLAVLIPASEAVAAARDLRDEGTVRRAWLGVRAVDLDPPMARLLAIQSGARLTQVDARSPAAAAGLETGDVITDVDGTAIGDASDLVLVLRRWRPGQQVTITWRRGTERSSAEITLGG